METARLIWTPQCFAYVGPKAPFSEALKAVFADAFAGPEALALDNIGLLLECLVIELLAQGQPVRIEVGTRYVLEHPPCGATFAPEAWLAREVRDQECESLLTGRPIPVAMRNCVCGSTVTYGSLRLREGAPGAAS